MAWRPRFTWYFLGYLSHILDGLEDNLPRAGLLRNKIHTKNKTKDAMDNFLKHHLCNSMVACLTLTAFTSAVIVPPPLHAALTINDINFGIKIEKIYEKVKKAIDRGETNKIVGYMFDFKHEVEQYSGNKIDINKQIDEVQKQAKAKGQKIDDKYIKQIKKDFGKEDKKHKHRAVWFANCMDAGIEYSAYEADMNFEMNYMMAKGATKYEQQEDVPAIVMVGVTVSLCGLFLYCVPLPGCQVAGGWLLNTGFGILSGYGLQKYDEYDREQRHKNK